MNFVRQGFRKLSSKDTQTDIGLQTAGPKS